MAEDLQAKVEKLIKYGNEKFQLDENTIRGILDNAKTSENLDVELNEQEEAIIELEDAVNKLPETKPTAKIEATLLEDGSYSLTIKGV